MNTTEHNSTLLVAATSQDLALYHTYTHTPPIPLYVLQPLFSFSWPVLRLYNYSFCHSLPSTHIIPSLLYYHPIPTCSTYPHTLHPPLHVSPTPTLSTPPTSTCPTHTQLFAIEKHKYRPMFLTYTPLTPSLSFFPPLSREDHRS